MRMLEIYFWDSIFLAMYLPIAFALQIITETGTILGTIIIGLFFTGIISAILIFVDGILYDDIEPAEIIYTTETKTRKKREPKKKQEIESEETKQTEQDNQPSSTEQNSVTENSEPIQETEILEPLEVKNNEETKNLYEGTEPEPKMRTDVNLDQLDADDDDTFD